MVSLSPTTIIDAPPSERITLLELARAEGVSPTSTWRWAMTGRRGLKLPTVRIGAYKYTTRAAFRDWCLEVTARENGEKLPSKSNKGREKQIAAAEAEAQKLGI